jgi:hypothetical protein
MRREITKTILKILSEGAVFGTAFLLAMVEAGYGASAQKLEKKFQEKYDELTSLPKIDAAVSRSYRVILARLKRDGLIEKTKGGWRITLSGREKYKKFKNKLAKNYSAENDTSLKVIVFDIPEKERRKRDWLRGVLVELGFTMLQKSVWIGKKRLPREFIVELHKLDLFNCLEIFTVNRTGSLE